MMPDKVEQLHADIEAGVAALVEPGTGHPEMGARGLTRQPSFRRREPPYGPLGRAGALLKRTVSTHALQGATRCVPRHGSRPPDPPPPERRTAIVRSP